MIYPRHPYPDGSWNDYPNFDLVVSGITHDSVFGVAEVVPGSEPVPEPVPEPSMLVLLGSGLGSLASIRKRLARRAERGITTLQLPLK